MLKFNNAEISNVIIYCNIEIEDTHIANCIIILLSSSTLVISDNLIVKYFEN